MRGLDERLSTGERVAWYRRRRGMSQEVLAGLVGRTVDWLSKVENGRAALDRLSVLSELADALDVSLVDLLGGPQLVESSPETGRHSVPALRRAVLSYTSLTPTFARPAVTEVDLAALRHDVADVWASYQASAFGYVVTRIPAVLAHANAAIDQLDGTDGETAYAHLAMTYQAAATTLTKLGEVDLAWICSDRGLDAAERSGNILVIGSLLRSVAHSLLSNAQYDDALAVTAHATDRLAPQVPQAAPQLVSVFGSLFLAGAMAAARSDNGTTAREMLNRADAQAQRLGHDANHVWTAFGPTNVAVHRVSVAMELGDVQVALDLGPRLDVTALPVERRVRHSLEVARAYAARNRADDGLAVLLAAEQQAPEQVRYHFLSRQLVVSWMRRRKTTPPQQLRQLAERIRVA